MRINEYNTSNQSCNNNFILAQVTDGVKEEVTDLFLTFN